MLLFFFSSSLLLSSSSSSSPPSRVCAPSDENVNNPKPPSDDDNDEDAAVAMVGIGRLACSGVGFTRENCPKYVPGPGPLVFFGRISSECVCAFLEFIKYSLRALLS